MLLIGHESGNLSSDVNVEMRKKEQRGRPMPVTMIIQFECNKF